MSEQPLNNEEERWKTQIEKQYGSLKTVFLLETNLDDVRGEILGEVISGLMQEGALDANLQQTITKKNRPGVIIQVICNEAQITPLISYLIRTTGTLGVRIRQEYRVCLRREIVEIKVPFGSNQYTVHVKHAYDTTNTRMQTKIEFEDLKHISHAENRPIREIEQRIWTYLKQTTKI